MSTEVSTAAEMIAPDEYNRALGELRLGSISIDALSCECDRDLIDIEKTDLSLESGATEKQVEKQWIVQKRYTLYGKMDDKQAFKIDVTFRLTFDCENGVPDGFFVVYGDTSLPMTTLPYLREVVGSMTMRMGLPALSLPYMVMQPALSEDAAD